MKYKVLFIDWDGTLSNSRFWDHWATDPNKQKSYKLIQNHFFKSSRDIVSDWMLGKFNAEQVINIIATKTNIDNKDLKVGLEHSCRHMEFINDNIINQVQNIQKRGTKVVIATDNMDTFPRWTVPAMRLNLLFDGILDSHTLQANKHDKAENGDSKFFLDYLKYNRINPQNTVLIDNSSINIAVEDFGINFIYVSPDYSASRALADISIM
jgi:beta-phosphoglucomutase-like phosphatase (HAD superfamily)